MNAPVAGYNILMILSAVDGDFNVAEDMVIREWLAEKFPFHVNLDHQMDTLSALDPASYMIYFQKAMGEFYKDSTEKERLELIQFAISLVKADHRITESENIYLNELFNEWTETEV